MEDDPNQTHKPNPNPNSNSSNTTKKKQSKSKKKKDEFEFCKVCKLNHDQGRRHNYFPRHTKSLSAFLSRFQTTLSDVRFFLRNPSLLRPQHADRNRLWCVFCDSDIHELSSSFACGNAIKHLASEDHLKNLKGFLWKYGGGMDRLDAFRISEVDLAKSIHTSLVLALDILGSWEKKCKSLENGAASEGSHGHCIGPSNDIRNELNSEYIDNIDKNNLVSLKSSFSNGVLPLQNYTIERYHQVSHSKLSEVRELTSPLHVHVDTQLDSNPRGLKDVTDYMDGQHSLLYDYRKSSADGSSNGLVFQDGRPVNGEINSQGLPNITQISSTVRENGKGNVHSGAPPPWFNATEANFQNVGLEPSLELSTVSSPLNKTGKSQKLNPKRVGAAWAEKRKIELEMERRGERIGTNFDSNWLPNFGRVWQSGSRKESRKEFEVEDRKPLKVEAESDTPLKIQPYISKRMRRDDRE